jgi:hypothetical protein
LDEYNKGLGQLVNKNKSANFFSSTCEQEVKAEVHSSLQIPNEALGERYFGLPTIVGRGHADAFKYVPARVRGFVGGWAEKSLSCAAREVLLKANAQSAPTYPISCFKLPPVVCCGITSAVSNYWWGSSLDNHMIHWQSWEKLTRSKYQGGMLGKHGWRLIVRLDSLCAKVLRGKYYPNSDFLSAIRKKRSSETWRSILYGRDALVKELIKRVGPGDINIWRENWIPRLQPLKPLVRRSGVSTEWVSVLYIPSTRVWDEVMVRNSFIWLEAEEVLKIKPGTNTPTDVVAWAFEKNGIYSVRPAYILLKDERAARAMAPNGEARASRED